MAMPLEVKIFALTVPFLTLFFLILLLLKKDIFKNYKIIVFGLIISFGFYSIFSILEYFDIISRMFLFFSQIVFLIGVIFIYFGFRNLPKS